jgi:hypothetical protein
VRRRLLAAALVLAGTAGVAACGGGGPRENVDRPPTPVTLTGAIHPRFVQISPARVGAGPITLVISNQTGRTQTVTMETANPAGSNTVGHTASTAPIQPQATGRLTIDARRGDYMVHVRDRTVAVAHVTVGKRRASSQNQLLLP